MAEFGEAVDETIEREGGDQFVDHPSDPGGATKYGISLRTARNHPEIFAADGAEVTREDIAELTREQAVEYYRLVWDRLGVEGIESQVIANKVFDLAVNMGDRQAVKLLQRALCAACRPTADDGIIGPVTLSRTNDAPKLATLAALRSEAAGFYRLLMAQDEALEDFRDGWLKRAYA